MLIFLIWLFSGSNNGSHGEFEGFGYVLFLGPFFIVLINLWKYLYLKSNKKFKLSFISFIGVTITEFFLCFFIYFFFLDILEFIYSIITGTEPSKIDKFFQSHQSYYITVYIYVNGMVYGIIATFLNTFLLKTREQKFIDILKTPSILVRAIILAFIFPIIFSISWHDFYS